MSTFKEAIQSRQEFVITCEHVPGRGYTGKGVDQILAFAEQMKGSDRIRALSITDNAGGNPAMSADLLGIEIHNMGVDPIVHFSCKDMNRNFIESRAFVLQRAGVTNLLVISGDYPISGFQGVAKPSFDIDSVNALHFLQKMNTGLEVQLGRKTATLAQTDFFLGACYSPYKWTEASLVMQYVKLEKKIRAGADYFITQLGYDSRKMMEAIAYVREHLGLDIPVLGSVYVLSAGAARFMNSGEVPGCFVSDGLVKTLQEEAKAEDKGKDARLTRAGKHLAILKGLGYNGAHVEGLNLKYEDVQVILGRAEEIGDNWRDHLPEFNFAPQDKPYYLFVGGETFEEPGKNGLKVARTRRRGIGSPLFWATRLLHKMLFEPKTPGYALMRGVCKWADKSKFIYGLLAGSERFAKIVLFDCRHCDDCALFQLYYMCPESKCPKGMRVGPCGGSRVNGRCEVFEENKCIWEKVYWRARNRKECEKLNFIIVPRDWNLYETSSWVNYYLGRDHSSIQLDIPEDVPGAKKRESIC